MLVIPDHKLALTSRTDAVMMEIKLRSGGGAMLQFCCKLWSNDEGQDIAEYAVMLAVILVLVVGTIRLIGGNANNAFSATASAVAQ